MSLKNWLGKPKTRSNAPSAVAHTQQNSSQGTSASVYTDLDFTNVLTKTLGTSLGSDTTTSVSTTNSPGSLTSLDAQTVYISRVNAVSRTEEGVWYIDGKEVGNIYELCRALCELRSVDFAEEIGSISDEV